jgi:hypothetical protein
MSIFIRGVDPAPFARFCSAASAFRTSEISAWKESVLTGEGGME